MKLKNLLTTLTLVAVFLFVGKVGWGQETVIYTTGFESSEGFTAGTVYNNTTVAYTGPTGKQWGTYYGTPSTTGFITGAQSMQMRYYTTAPTNFGYTFTNFDLAKVTKVTFKAKDNSNVADVTVSYSTDGGSSYTGDQTFALATASAPFEYIVSATGEYANVRIKFTLAGTTVAERLTIDDVVIYGIDDVAPIATWNPANATTDVAVNTPVTITFNEAIRDITTDANFDNTTVDALITSFETVVGATPVTFDATIDATNKIITVTPAADLASNTEYTITLAAVEDAVNNATTVQTIAFTTIDPTAPTISGVAITEVAPYYAGDNITVTWTSANVDFVKIEAWVPSSSAWEEIVATTDATDGSEAIAIPANAYYSTSYKVRVSYVTTPTVNAESSAFTIIATPTINDIQSQTSDGNLSVYDGQIVRTSGIVTFSGTGAYVIQDGDGSWNGIFIYDFTHDGESVEGQNITVQATVANYNGVTQLTTTTSLVVNSSGNPLPAITTLTTSQLTEAYEGVLVKVINAPVTVAPASGKFTINDGSGALIVDDNIYASAETGILVGQDLTITGIGHYNNEFQLLPRYAADMVSATDTVGSTVYSVNQGGLTITNIPYGTSLATFEGNVTPAANATFETYQADGTSVAADLASGYKVIVTAQDGITKSTYTLTINAASTDASVTSGTYTVNSTDNTISNVPSTETLATFKGNITPAAGASFEVYLADGTTVATDLATGYKLICTAEDGSTKKTYTITLNTEPNHEANITAYSILGVNGTINSVDHTVAVTVPYGTTLTNLVATFTLSTNATAKVATVAQESGVTANNFTSPVVYAVTAEDAATTVNWTVTVTAEAPSAIATVTSTVYTVNSTDNTITNVPYNETLATFEGNLTPATGATFETYLADGTTVATDLATGYKVTVTAQDAVTLKTYTITLNAAPSNDLFISEYIEGTSNNKAIEIFNPTASAVDLSQYSLKKGSNGADFSSTLALSGTLESGSVYVVANSGAVDSIKNVANYIDAAGTIVYFNGDDAIGLFKGDVLIDVIGLTTGDPGTNWPVAGTGATSEFTLVRQASIITGTTDWAASAGTDAANSQWIVYPQDRFAYLGWHVESSEANILTFVLAEQTGNATINATNNTVVIEVVNGTSLTALVPTITLSKMATITPASGVAQNFTAPVVYTVTAQDGTIETWTVTVNVATALSSEKDITTFSIPSQVSADINATAATVNVVMPVGTNLTNLTPTIEISAGASINPATGVAQNFSSAIEYTVTAQDASTKVWTVTVTEQQIPVVTIHDIQYTTATPADSPYKGQQVITKGLVVAIKSGTSSTSFYMQNGSGEWNGIYVYSSTTPVAVGDSVRFTAVVDEYYTLTELKTITNLTVINSNNSLPAPANVTVAQAGSEAYEGVFVKLTNVECTVMPDANKEWTVSDGTNTLLVNDFLYEYTPAQGTHYNITGVIDYSFNAFKLNPRNADDVAVYTSTPDRPFASFNVYPNPFSNELRFDGANISRVTVTSIIGQVVMDRTISSENYINTQELVRGIYLVKFTNAKGESTLRKLIKE